MYLNDMFDREDPSERQLHFLPTIAFNKDSHLHKNTVKTLHPESDGRIEAIVKRLQEEGLYEKCQVAENFLFCDDGELSVTHTSEYVSELTRIERMDQKEINEWASKFDSVFATPYSYNAALSAVTCTRSLAEWIVRGKIPCGFSIVRPPGHHADSHSACGFCLLNNVAQGVDAARVVGAQRILIVDLDVHHGQGTQRIFYNDDKVLYFSIHRHEYGAFWPNLEESGNSFIGEDAGKGRTVNVPLQETGCGDSDYLFAFFSLLLPIAHDFAPDFVIVSAGFDCLRGDPLGCMDVTPEGYSHLIHHLKSLANGKVLLVLEGGYNHDMSASAVTECVKSMIGHRPSSLSSLSPPMKSTRESVMNTIAYLLPFYPSLHRWNTNEFMTSYPTPSCTQFNPPSQDIPTADIDQSMLVKPRGVKEDKCESGKIVIIHTGKSHIGHREKMNNSFEKPERIDMVISKVMDDTSIEKNVIEVSCVSSDIEEDILRVHNKEFVDRMRMTQEMSHSELEVVQVEWDHSFVTRGTWTAATTAVAATIQGVSSVVVDGSPNSLCIVRPPGHHSHPQKASGFCFFNNVAIAANYARSRLGVDKVLIMDWDVHLGDGTIKCLQQREEDESILYISVHRSDEGTFFPSSIDHDKAGRHILIPLSGGPMGDAEYMTIMHKLIIPIAYSFCPSLILVSAGFDCLRGDPLGGYEVSPCTLSTISHHLSAVAPLVCVMEGGYDLHSLSEGMCAVAKTLSKGVVEGRNEKGRKRANDVVLHTINSLVKDNAHRFSLL